MDLTEEELLGETCQRLLDCGRLSIVRQPLVDAVVPELVEEEVEPPVEPPAPVEESTGVETVLIEKSTPAPAEASVPAEPLEPVVEAVSTDPGLSHAEASAVEPAVAEPVETEPATEVEEGLEDMGYRDLQAACRELGLSSSGTTEELRARLLQHKGGE
jgi:hypothetical protein